MKIKFTILSVCLVGCLFVVITCKNEMAQELPTVESKAITQILKADPNFSILVKALDTTNLSGMLNIYGTYTLFAPDNDAFAKYFTEKHIGGLNDISVPDLKRLLLYHMYGKQYSSSSFVAGSLPGLTAAGEFIKMDISKGVLKTMLNDEVNVKKLDIVATNGVVHVIDNVLTPPAKTIMDWLTANPKYSIITEVFVKTGVDALLNQVYENDTVRVRYTAFLETDSVFKLAGFNTFDQLAAKYSKTGDYKDPDDSLNIFAKYHLLKKNLFLSDITDSYTESLHPSDYITFSITGGIFLNTHYIYTTSGTTTDSTLVRTSLLVNQSNTITKNGVIHTVNKPFTIYNPTPQYVMVSYVKDCSLWPGNGCTNSKSSTGCTTAKDQEKYPWIKWFPYNAGTYIAAMPNQLSGPSSFRILMADATYWVELTTPKIFKGTYDVLFNWNRTTGGPIYPTVQMYLDGVKINDPVNMGSTIQRGVPGYPSSKQHLYMTTVKLDSIGIHKIKFVCLKGGYNAWFDAIEFKPR